MSAADNKQFKLPTPKFSDETEQCRDKFTKLHNPHFSTPSGMLLPRDKQPPPMYGPRGSTIAPRFLNYQHNRKGPPQGNHHQHRYKGPRGSFNNNSGLDKDVIPALLGVNWSLWCEGCDVNCTTEDHYKNHLAEHTACSVEECKYVGHPGVMKRHWRMAHDEKRLAEKAQANTKQTPEEIEKWRAERRKRYPTQGNVERRQQAQDERFNRGERIEEDKKRFPNRNHQDGRNNLHTHAKKFGGQPRQGTKRLRKSKPFRLEKKESDELDTDSRISFKGTSSLKDYKEKAVNALSLLTGYGSESEEISSDGGSNEEYLEATKIVSDANTSKKSLQKEADLSEGELIDSENEVGNPERIHISDDEVCKELDTSSNLDQVVVPEPEQSEQKDTESKSKRRNRFRKRKNDSSQMDEPNQVTLSKKRVPPKPLLDYTKLRYARQNTMLEKLLEPDIRHERNVLLQCVRFVVENKFFGIGQSKQESAEIPNENVELNKT
ncbi:FMR1-interacting protein NUFIP1 [Toxorhynchites rutilus septentrionalis]|uniref:FMR1-interacting protein NUFIP1 n=1 Tax=Toxorhynchites rutilus septentrionalis TaxID=329112 RepID=UPI00247A769F|nr:FMR1-interacting protein NUFIP1 [Toxorhynchites rutilus septentrionalis]